MSRRKKELTTNGKVACETLRWDPDVDNDDLHEMTVGVFYT